METHNLFMGKLWKTHEVSMAMFNVAHCECHCQMVSLENYERLGFQASKQSGIDRKSMKHHRWTRGG